jgi:DNA helicase-4
MIVSRNNKDINKYIDNDFTLQDNILTFNNRSIKYYTIHKSKGLEAEYVIVINCNDSYLGFPNKIESNAIINKLLPNNEIRFAEERRLFYVAITRCKKQVFLLYDKNLPSIFIKEIKKITKKIVHNNTIFK